jgi:hypothetical protein
VAERDFSEDLLEIRKLLARFEDAMLHGKLLEGKMTTVRVMVAAARLHESAQLREAAG